MEFNNKYYLIFYPKIKKYIDNTEKYVNEKNLELAFLNLRRAVEHIDREYLKNDNWYLKIINKNGQMPCLDNMNVRLYELRIFDEEQLTLFQHIRKLSNEYVHGTRNDALRKKDRKILNRFCTELNTYFPLFAEMNGIKLNKKQIKEIKLRERENRNSIVNKILRLFY